MKQAAANVIKNERILLELERPGARSILGSWIIWLRCPEIAREAKPGQFVMVSCGDECTLPRPFSIHQVDDTDIALFFAVWEDGKGTAWLSQRQAGDNIDLFGPLGNGFKVHPASNKLLLVAGGVGIAPLYFLAEQALEQEYSVRMLLGASGAFKPSEKPNPSQLYPKELLPPGMKLKTITTSPDGKKDLVIDLLSKYVDGTDQTYIDWADQVFACGPLPMYKKMAQMQELKDRPVQVSLEVGMACGLGVCYGCSIKTKAGLKQVCKDGPVFNLEDIIWDELNSL